MDKTTYNIDEIADFFEVTPRSIQLWVQEDGMPKDSRGNYDLIKCAKWKIKHLQKELDIAKNSIDDNLHALKLEGQSIQNKKYQVALKKELNKLVDKHTATIAWTNQINVIKNVIGSLMHKLKRDLEDINNEAEKSKVIDESFSNTLAEIGSVEIERYILNEERLVDDD